MRRSTRRKLLLFGGLAIGVILLHGWSGNRSRSDTPWEDEEEYFEDGDVAERAAPRAARNELPDAPLPAGLDEVDMATARRAQRLAKMAHGKETAETAKQRAARDTARQYAEEAQGNPNPPAAAAGLATTLHPAYTDMLKEYPFQAVRTQRGEMINLMLVRAAMNKKQRALFEMYKNDILFMGISSFEDFPLPSVNPFSGRYPLNEYLGLFPGFLHMLHQPEKVFPPHVKTILMSQSDFSLPTVPPRDYSEPKKWDFTYSGSDQDVLKDCVGWSSFAKNWTFMKQALEVMCTEYNITGVLVATKSKDGKKACTIPPSCEGKILQTTFLDQRDFYGYLKNSRFSFLPQIHDASPRVSSQALALDVPFLMNAHISGGWKYMTDRTGEFFHDMYDFRQNLDKILHNSEVKDYYTPQAFATEHYGDTNSGKRLLKFVRDNFLDKVHIPEGTTLLLT